MDTAQELLEELRRVRRDLDQFDVRLGELERRSVPATFSRAKIAQHRRQAVIDLRRQGMSLGAIANRLGVAIKTVHADLRGERVPETIVGLDGYRVPNRWGNGHPQA